MAFLRPGSTWVLDNIRVDEVRYAVPFSTGLWLGRKFSMAARQGQVQFWTV